MRSLLVVSLAALLGCPGAPTAPGTDAETLHYLEQTLWQPSQGGRTICAYETLGDDERSREVYVWAICQEHLGAGAFFGARSGPVVLDVDSNGTVTSHREPRDGSAFWPDVRQLFPARIRATFKDRTSQAQQARVERLRAAVRSRAEPPVAR